MRVAELQEQCKGYQLRLSGMDGAREELSTARSALELAHKNHKEQIAKVASYYQKDVVVKARVMMLTAYFIHTLTLTGVQ